MAVRLTLRMSAGASLAGGNHIEKTSSFTNLTLTLEERRVILSGIINGSTKAAIARIVGKDKSASGEEIKAHRILVKNTPCSWNVLPAGSASAIEQRLDLTDYQRKAVQAKIRKCAIQFIRKPHEVAWQIIFPRPHFFGTFAAGLRL